MKDNYPAKLFWIGVLLNIIRKFIFVVASIVLMIMGIWNAVYLYIGFAILGLVIIISLIQQLKYRNIMLQSEDPNLAEFQKAVLDENWQSNIMNMIEKTIRETQEKEEFYLQMSQDDMNKLPDDELLKAVLARTEHKVDSFENPEDGFRSLNDSQRVLYSVNYLETEVNNGGLCQFFVNSSRMVAPYISEYMSIIGADDHQKLYDDFVSKNNIDLTDLSSFNIDDVDEFEDQNKRYPFEEYDNAFYEMEPLETYFKKYVKDNLKDF